MDGVVYVYVNTINGKVYVGQTINFRHRIAMHRVDSKKRHSHFYNAVKKYGWDNFEILQLSRDIQTHAELDNLERVWIALLKATDREYGYNILAGGNSVGTYNFGKPKSPEHRAKLAAHLRQVWAKRKRVGQKPSGRPKGSKTSVEGIENIKKAQSLRQSRTKMSLEERRRVRAAREKVRRERIRATVNEHRQSSF